MSELPKDAAHAASDSVMIYQRCQELARFSAEGPNRLTRLYLTPEHKAAAAHVAGWMRDAGMLSQIDAVGTVVGRYESDQPDAPTLLLGSHIDTVRNAGKYDGNLGVITAIQAVRRLSRAGLRLPFAIEVLAFGDEEGVRFPVTLTSSQAVAGNFDPASLAAADADGILLRDALVAFGGSLEDIGKLGRDRHRTLGYVEVHIEQGPVLEGNDLPVGIVTAISGATRMTVSVQGFAGHAGTVPMELRQDAGTAASEMVLAVEIIAQDAEDVVATVGQMTFEPGAVNVIPSAAKFTVDLRSPSDASRLKASAGIEAAFKAIANRRTVTVETRNFYNENAATCDPDLINALAKSVEASGILPLYLPSGAGHDGLAIASLCPFAMLFVRCKGGISHNPAEEITPEDAGAASNVLHHFLISLDPATLRQS